MVFAFRKMKAISRDAQGVPVYEEKQPSLATDVETERTEKEKDNNPEDQKTKRFKSDSTT